LDQEIRDLEAIHQHVQRKKKKMLRLADLQKKIDEVAEEIHHLTRTEDLNTESFIKTIPTMMMNGMMISIMEILLLMMLLLRQ
jgi:cell shape-determining protein MreC